MNTDPRINAYIEKQAAFAQPILKRIRAQVQASVPDMSEDIKWGMPAFTIGGRLFFGMAAFKAHLALNFWHGAAVTGGTGKETDAMGSFGRITSVDDLPDDVALTKMIVAAADLARSGVKPKHMTERKARPELPMPAALQTALDGNAAAAAHWAGFAPSHRRDYCEWIGETKRPETAAKRVAEAIGWIADGKRRNWKYEDC